MDNYEYVMCGKIFRVKDIRGAAGDVKVEVLVSFGGLIMQLIGRPSALENLDLDKRIYLCVTKI